MSDDQLTKLQKNMILGEVYRHEFEHEKEISENQLRIMTWNIERGYSPEKLQKYIIAKKPDILCLQEVDWGNKRTNNLNVMAYLCETTDMHGYFGIEFFELDHSDRDEKLAGGGVHGNAILSRFKPEKVYCVELPVVFDWENPPIKYSYIAKREPRIGNRFALCAEFNINGSLITICSVHLEDKPSSGIKGRKKQFLELLSQIKPSKENNGDLFIIAGDLNTLDNPLARLMGFTNANTSLDKSFLGKESKWWIDNIFSDQGLGLP